MARVSISGNGGRMPFSVPCVHSDWTPDKGAYLASPRLTIPSCQPSLSGSPVRESPRLWATTMSSSFIPSSFFLSLALVPLRNWTQTSCCLTSQNHHCECPPCHIHLLRGEVRRPMQTPSPGDQHRPVTNLLIFHSPPLLGNKVALGSLHWELPLRGCRSWLYLRYCSVKVRLPSLGTANAPVRVICEAGLHCNCKWVGGNEVGGVEVRLEGG